MSTAAANAGLTTPSSRAVPAFVGLFGACAAALVADSVVRSDHWYRWEFLSLLLVGVLTSRLKVKLPGLSGNMSVNLPFIFVAMTQLSLAEALFVAGISIFVQSLPKRSNKFKPVQVFFNVCSSLVATGMGWEILHYTTAVHFNSALVLVMGCAMHFFASTFAVSTIISLTENQDVRPIWSSISHLSFPYYVASTGIASIAAAVGSHAGWVMLVGVCCVMFVMYRSYRLYFGMVALSAPERATAPIFQAKSAAGTR
jgi:hypothetical protein